MTKAAQAYGKVANQISSPREMEADKLLFAASQLQAIRDALGCQEVRTQCRAVE